MKTWLLVLLVIGPLTAVQAPQFPQASIARSRLRARLYLPDAKAGYYRGTRFDWSGVIASLSWNEHEYFGQWFDKYDPLVHDAITGPVEEFLTGESALGYAEAKPGEVFVRIGVGAVRKPDEPAYRRFATYEITDHGKWTVDKGADWIELAHELGDTMGYAYEYRKKVRLEDDRLVIEHRLRNTGRKAIATSVYNHNFFTLDGQRTGPGVVVRFAFEPRAARSFNGVAEVRGREIVFVRELQARETIFSELEGYGAEARDYDVRVENQKSGAGMHITGDRPLSKLLFWSAAKTVCPEPYIDASVEPGQESTWRLTYQPYKASPSP